MSIGEFDLIARWFARAGRPLGRGVSLGVGDDCAIVSPQPGHQLAVSSDMLVEGRHFLSTVPPEALGHKALAVNLSDLAACGARPLAFTLAWSVPRVDEAFVDGFARGLFALADDAGIELVGGDTTAGPLNICITVFGEVPVGEALLRSGARAGDDLWVSGVLGDARLALEAFRGRVSLAGAAFQQARRAMEWPQPRLALGLALRGVASSAIDLSDGLLGDLGHLCERSGVGADLQLDDLPRSVWLAEQDATVQSTCLLAGGDDYELLFSAASARREDVLAAAHDARTPVHRIGQLGAAPGCRLWCSDGRRYAGPVPRSFDHFSPS
jgi:thiamine-monophosphate kinase